MKLPPRKHLTRALDWARPAIDAIVDPSREAAAIGHLELLADDTTALAAAKSRHATLGRQLADAGSTEGQKSDSLTEARDVGRVISACEARILGHCEAILALYREDRDVTDEADSPQRLAGIPAYFGEPFRSAAASIDTISIRRDCPAALRDAYVGSHPAATAYHDSGLLDVFTAHTGCEVITLTALNESGSVVGTMPVARLRTALFGDYAVSLPWVNYGGPLADSAPIGEHLAAEAADLVTERGCTHLEIRETRPRAGWISRTHKVSMVLPLPADIASFDRSLGSKVRAQAKRALAANATFEIGGGTLLGEFYDVFTRNMRDLGTPVHHRDLFADLLEVFGEKARLAVVRFDGKAVAVGLTVRHGDSIEIPWASSLHATNRFGSNMFLYYRVLIDAIERGCRCFDFGRSTRDGPTFRFKRQWGATPLDLHWHYRVKDGATPAEPDPDSAKFRLAIAAWRRLPVAVANRLGPYLIRGLP